MPHSPLALKIAAEITNRIAAGEIQPGSHLATEALAGQFQVSRSPIREALAILSSRELLENKKNRGFFVKTDAVSNDFSPQHSTVGTRQDEAYFQFAEEWLSDKIESEITELAIRERYRLTKTQAQDILTRAAREGWAEPKSGYGWRLRPVAKTSEAFEQIYRFRAVIEPAAILEPTFRFDRTVANSLRRVQEKMAAGQIEKLPPETLTGSGAIFHEELMKMSGNLMFFQALERANQLRRLVEYRLMVNPRRVIAQSVEHIQILDLLEVGDNLEAAHLMRRHLSGALAVKSPVVHPRQD